MTIADLAIFGASVRTLDPAQPHATAIAIHDGAIIAVGDDAAIRAYCDRRTEEVDGQGLAIVPGLVDAHLHPFLGAVVTQGVDLGSARTLDDLRALLSAEDRRAEPGSWIKGWGLHYEVFAETGIRGDLLAEAAGGRPAILVFFDYHTAVATPAAIAASGITHAPSFDDNSAVAWDDGGATGELRENGAMSLVLKTMPEPTAAQRYGWYVDAMRRMNAVGITAVHGMDGDPGTHELLRELEGNGDLSVRMIMPLWQKPDTTRDEMRAQIPYRDAHGRRWRGGVAKFFIDGVIETGTGWLTSPDTQGDCREPFWPDPAYYADAVALFAGAGFQCVTHAVGDMGVRCALDAYKAAGAAPGIHHRIEHIELLEDSDLPRFAAEGVVASMQPLHVPGPDPELEGAWVGRVGSERIHRSFRVGDLQRSGAIVALGSDWHVADFDPRRGMAAARLRKPPHQPDLEPFLPEQLLTPLETLTEYTINAAGAVSEAHRNGRIAPGYRADLTAFAADPVDSPADDLPDLPVLLTMVDGEVVFRA